MTALIIAGRIGRAELATGWFDAADGANFAPSWFSGTNPVEGSRGGEKVEDKVGYKKSTEEDVDMFEDKAGRRG